MCVSPNFASGNVVLIVRVSVLKDETLHIRIAGVDAPESSYFGKPGQLGADMVKSWLRKEVEGKTMWVELLRKDQYNRVVRTYVFFCCSRLGG